MSKNKQLCVDIILLGTDYEGIFFKTYERIQERQSYARGAVYRHDSETRTKLISSENELFKGIANEFITGDIVGVDGILPDGINVSANVLESESARVRYDFNRFRVKSEIDI